MRRHALLLTLFALTLVAMLFTGTVSAGSSSSRVDESTDYVDNNSSDVDSHTDHGTHSSFAAEQSAPDSSYDTLTEANTGGGAGGSEWIYVNAFSATETTWTPVGTTPYLGAIDNPNHIIDTTTDGAAASWFDFPSTSLTGTLTVNISMYCNNDDGASNDYGSPFVDYTGSGSGSDVGDFGQHTAYSWDTISLGTHTVAEVNALRVRFVLTKVGGADNVRVDCCRIGVSSSGSPDNYELDLEVQWASADYDETREDICVYCGSQDAEALKLQVWNSSNSQWYTLSNDLTASQWNNFTVYNTVGATTLTLRFLGGTESSDSTQSTWQIDSTCLHVYSTSYTNEMYESVPLAESIVAGIGRIQNLFEQLTLADFVTRAAGYARTLFDQLNLAESVVYAAGYVRTLFEELPIAETVYTAAAFVHNLFEALAIAVTCYAQKISGGEFQQFLYELLGITVTTYPTAQFSRTLFESLPLADSLLAAATYGKFLFESLPLSETLAYAIAYGRQLGELLTILETVIPVKSGLFTLDLFEWIQILLNNPFAPYITTPTTPPTGGRGPVQDFTTIILCATGIVALMLGVGAISHEERKTVEHRPRVQEPRVKNKALNKAIHQQWRVERRNSRRQLAAQESRIKAEQASRELARTRNRHPTKPESRYRFTPAKPRRFKQEKPKPLPRVKWGKKR